MALDLLDTKWTSDHKYRHDLESLFYIILCLTCRYKEPGHLLADPPFDDWFSGTDYDVFKAKYAVIGNGVSFVTTPYFSGFSHWVFALHRMFSLSVLRKLIHEIGLVSDTLDEEEFSYDRVKGIMSTFAGVALEERWF